MGPLEGIKVIDLTSVVMGPYATQVLAEFGADVIKIEAPAGDLVRAIGPARHSGMGPMFLNSNRGKRSITLDLKTPEGREVVLELCRSADVLAYNVRPAAMARLGLSFEALAEVNPRLIYAGLYGFGQNGPYAARPAYDDLIQGGATLAHLFRLSGNEEPRYVPTAISDRVVGLTGVAGILAALVARGRTGRGQRVDIPMFETMVQFVLSDHLGGLSYDPPLDGGGYARQLSVNRRPLKTADGYICALVYTDEHWKRFLTALGEEEKLRDPRFADYVGRSVNIDHVYGWMTGVFLTRSTAEWQALFEEIDVPAMPLHDFDSVLRDPHLTAVDFFARVEHPSEGALRVMRNPVALSDTPVTLPGPAPRQGEHSRDILRGAGLSEAQIDSLFEKQVVRGL
ncbi:CaiB/BaiF CoA transferase family protein [Falsigemmobacter intermedius]|uniref:CaiB/BaiF CoA transferase family protein n=1 Tax=Falsigemmobacter intermedius TaxID=1553448 RepID=UPI003EFF1184